LSSEIYFNDNYRDLSQQSGISAGFQFEFSCQRCHDTWRSPFEGYAGARMAGWLNRGASAASGLLGRLGGDVSSAADGLAGAGWGHARDTSLRRAVATAQSHFSRCPRCTSHVCARCWNAQQGLCLVCAPDTAAELAASRQRGLNDEVSERGYAAGRQQGGGVDVQSSTPLVCPQCRAETHGSRFCGGCGHELARQNHCTGCGGTLPDTAAFCPDCGHRR
jgi:hypothetical protein